MPTKRKPSAAEIRRVMKHLSDLGAAKGGRARAAKLSSERRREIARKAAKARWTERELSQPGST